MQYPAFVFPWLGNGMLIALDAVLHVIISHGVAIGAVGMIVLAEYIGLCRNEEEWDRFAHGFLKTLIIIITGVGAPTGVGIWLVTSIVAPKGIASLLRVFFWPWFIEWMVFTLEVILLLLYYFSWEKLAGDQKKRHVRLGIYYVISALASAFLISGILSFMLTPDGWPTQRGLLQAFFNPTFLPHLFTRLGIAGTLGGVFALSYAAFSANATAVRQPALRLFSKISVASLLCTVAGTGWYLAVVPSRYTVHIPFALLTSRLSDRPYLITVVATLILVVIVLFSVVAYSGTLRLTRVLAVPAMLCAIFYVVGFERAREFIRGPYLMPGYLYANQLLLTENHLMAKEGITRTTPWYATLADGTAAGQGAFLFAQNCSACHTLRGINGIAFRVQGRTEDGLAVMVAHLNEMVPFMPPFSGTVEERRILARYLANLPTAGSDPSRYTPQGGNQP